MERVKNLSERIVRGGKVGIIASIEQWPYEKNFRDVTVISPDDSNQYKISRLLVSAGDLERANIWTSGVNVVFGSIQSPTLAKDNDLERLKVPEEEIAQAHAAYSRDLEEGKVPPREY